MSFCCGVCSWSLQPGSAEELVQKVKAVGVSAVQLALDPLRSGSWPTWETVAMLKDAGLQIRSGMMVMCGEDYSTLESIRHTGGVRPDEHWETNLNAARQNAVLARALGIELVTFHAGFLPHEREDPLRKVLIDRLRAIVDRFAFCGVRVGFETGQEKAETLLGVLEELDRPQVGVNFDPANMLLYGMGDPVSALNKLAPHVLQIHIKDAIAAREPGVWGTEVPVGQGQVDWPTFFETLKNSKLSCDLMIERESGEDRIGDIRQAGQLVERFIGTGEAFR